MHGPVSQRGPGRGLRVALHEEVPGAVRSVLEALRTLPRRQRECLTLRYYADLSERETADALGVSVGTVKSTTSRGLAALASKMEQWR